MDKHAPHRPTVTTDQLGEQAEGIAAHAAGLADRYLRPHALLPAQEGTPLDAARLRHAKARQIAEQANTLVAWTGLALAQAESDAEAGR